MKKRLLGLIMAVFGGVWEKKLLAAVVVAAMTGLVWNFCESFFCCLGLVLSCKLGGGGKVGILDVWGSRMILVMTYGTGTAVACLLAKPLNALQMGDRYAASMGVNVRAVRCAIILVSSVLSAAVTAFAGPVSFIGLAVPHICRILFHTSDSRILLPAAMLGGALMAGLCDFAARTIVSPAELPLGAITAVIGAPVVVFLLTRKDKL